MSQPLTTREVLDEIRHARAEGTACNDAVGTHTSEMLRAKNEYEIAKGNLERAEADAFIDAKDAGATDQHAKALMVRKTQVEREVVRDKRKAYEDAKGHRETAERQASFWKAALEALTSTTYALNRELKMVEAPY